ncbi:MAG: hypothetical protein A2096_03105 [Spirochaetes bacterium GWF1_41_5]|nr:MAG: hypothetical protein A2096_03105 [Spirochaetes bacterium GWF1_41_5]
MSISVIEKLNEEIKKCMKEKNQSRLDTVRMLKNKIMQVNARGEVSEDEAVKIFKNYAKSLADSIDVYRKSGKNETVTAIENEISIIREFLPPELNADELSSLCRSAIEKYGKEQNKFGMIMKEVMALSKGRADGAAVKQMVTELLK